MASPCRSSCLIFPSMSRPAWQQSCRTSHIPQQQKQPKEIAEMKPQHLKKTLVAGLLGLCLPLAASAAGFPAKPITFVVPFGPGSATDQLARAIGQGVSEQSGQTVVIEN